MPCGVQGCGDLGFVGLGFRASEVYGFGLSGV